MFISAVSGRDDSKGLQESEIEKKINGRRMNHKVSSIDLNKTRRTGLEMMRELGKQEECERTKWEGHGRREESKGGA